MLDPSPDLCCRPAAADIPGLSAANKAPWLVDGAINEIALAQMAYSPQLLLIDGNADLLAEYKATMHIDLLEEWQGHGWGRRLINRFVESVRDVALQDGGASKGIWIGVAADNAKVVPFYEKLGFHVKEREIKTESICLVRGY